jgi:hypothetical protein
MSKLVEIRKISVCGVILVTECPHVLTVVLRYVSPAVYEEMHEMKQGRAA